MRPGFATRRVLQLALTANALRPSHGPRAAIPSFAAGWPVGELAPQLLGLTVADTALHLARHRGRSGADRLGLAASALSAAGLAALITSAGEARDTVENALRDAFGADYRAELPPPEAEDLREVDPALQPGFAAADTTVQACAPLYGVYDFAATSGSNASAFRLRRILARYVVGRDPDQHHDEYVAASPLDRVSDAAPPFFVLHGAHDTLIPVAEARTFTERLRARSANPVAYAEIPGAQHAFDIFGSIRSTHVVRGVQRFLEYTRRKPGPPQVAAP